MTAISSVSAAPSLAPASPALPQPASLPPAALILDSPSSLVTLGQTVRVVAAQTYDARGAIANPDVAPAWEYTQQDKVSLVMQGNFSTTYGVSRFQGLAASLTTQLAQTGKGISQSVIRSTTGSALEPAALAAAQKKLHSDAADTSISLTLKTASGKTVQLTLTSTDQGLAVQADIDGGELSAKELLALGKMADGFQSAIDGLTAKPPQLKLDALTRFDSTVFASVQLDTRIKLDDGTLQTLAFRADDTQRTVRMSGATGDLSLNVDLKNLAIIGSAAQQAKALNQYLGQIDAARKRGDGDPQLLSMFQDAFKTLHSHYPGSRESTVPQTVSSVALTDTDHALLSGLADFSASVTERTTASNPARPNELDSFAYDLSQRTQAKGRDQLNRTLVQDQQSHLVASYHKPLTAGQKLDLSKDPQSQNYLYYEINDSASSRARIGYDKGQLVEASVTQSASQSTRVSKYVMGRLESETLTPAAASKTRNLLSALQQALQQDKAARLGHGVSLLEDTLAGIQASAILQSDPASLR